MVSSFTPPILYLSDDDDGNHETEHNLSYEQLIHRKRKHTDANVRLNPSIVTWSKRHRNGDYYQLHPAQNFANYQSDTTVIHPNVYSQREQDSHSFHAFDWTTEPQTTPRMYSSPFRTTSRLSFPPSTNFMDVATHPFDQSDTIPMTYQHDRYIQQPPPPQRKVVHLPMSSTSPPSMSLPLPSPTSSITRPTAQRIQPGQTIRSPYGQRNPPPLPPPLLPVHHQTESVFKPKFHTPSPVLTSTPIATPEIRRQPLNGAGILSAFYDSKCYQCNICKFKSITSSAILQHIFTHIFFCSHCPFYTYSHHNLYQHVFQKHNSNLYNDTIDPKNLDLLYITRCTDGTFALCMDTSPRPPPPSPKSEEPSTPAVTAIKPKPKRRAPRKKVEKPKIDPGDDIVILSEKRNIDACLSPPPTSTPSSSSSITQHPAHQEKPTHTYVLMKQRRFYSITNPCLHALTLEYNICREYTIRHMCHTQRVLKKRYLIPASNILTSMDEVVSCLKTVVNNIVEMEENRDSPDLLCALPHNIICSIFPDKNFNILMTSLKLHNKYDSSFRQKKRTRTEESVRTSRQHDFIFASPTSNNDEESIFASLHTSITMADSIYTRTNLTKLPILLDNTYRFLKSIPTQPTTSTTKPIKKKTVFQSTNPEPAHNVATNSLRYPDIPSRLPIVDRNNNSVTSSKLITPSVIVLD